jgi:hypothetical protein
MCRRQVTTRRFRCAARTLPCSTDSAGRRDSSAVGLLRSLRRPRAAFSLSSHDLNGQVRLGQKKSPSLETGAAKPYRCQHGKAPAQGGKAGDTRLATYHPGTSLTAIEALGKPPASCTPARFTLVARRIEWSAYPCIWAFI